MNDTAQASPVLAPCGNRRRRGPKRSRPDLEQIGPHRHRLKHSRVLRLVSRATKKLRVGPQTVPRLAVEGGMVLALVNTLLRHLGVCSW